MMKTKFFVIFAAILFAAITVYNLQLVQTQNLGDISLADITVMAQADGEDPGELYCQLLNCRLSFCYSHSNYTECVNNGELTSCSKKSICP